MIVIEKGVPLPNSNGEIKLALLKLERGDSFFLPNLTISGRTALYRLAKHYEVKVMTRVVDGGVRVWRIS